MTPLGKKTQKIAIDAFNEALSSNIERGYKGAQNYSDIQDFLSEIGFGEFNGDDFFGATVDAEITGYEDGDDIPGEAAPETWWDQFELPSFLTKDDFEFRVMEGDEGEYRATIEYFTSAEEKLRAVEVAETRIENFADLDTVADEDALFEAFKSLLIAEEVDFHTPASAGSSYVEITNEETGEVVKIRFSHHSNQSAQHLLSDINVATRDDGGEYATHVFSDAVRAALNVRDGLTYAGETI